MGFIAFLIFWGMVVIADSPLFSTLVAHNAPTALKGTALTIVNCIGYLISVVSIGVLNQLDKQVDENNIFLILAFGPIFGIFSLLTRGRRKKNAVHPEST